MRLDKQKKTAAENPRRLAPLRSNGIRTAPVDGQFRYSELSADLLVASDERRSDFVRYFTLTKVLGFAHTFANFSSTARWRGPQNEA